MQTVSLSPYSERHDRVQDPHSPSCTLQAAMGMGGGNIPLIPIIERVKK